MTFSRCVVLAAVLIGGCPVSVFAAKSKPPGIEQIIATPQHLKDSLAPKTILVTRLKVGPAGPEVAQAIQDARLDEVTAFFSLPDGGNEPELVKPKAPEYPYDLRRKGIGGSAKFLVLIGADGAVRSLYCYQSSHPLFAASAGQALAAWKFKPASIDGTAVQVLVNQTLDFNAN